MEFMQGGTFYKRLNRGVMSNEQAKFYFFQICKAVEYMHNSKLAHRDLKPANMMLESNDEYTRLKLIDFGISKTTSCMRSVVGTST